MPLIALEVILGFVVPVGWGAWELISLRRERRRDAQAATPPASAAPESGTPAATAPSTPAASPASQGAARD